MELQGKKVGSGLSYGGLLRLGPDARDQDVDQTFGGLRAAEDCSFIVSDSLIYKPPRKIGKIRKISDLRSRLSPLMARSFFLSDLSGVLSGKFGTMCFA